MKKNKTIPQFKNEDEERDFWANHSFVDYVDQFKQVDMDLSKLKPTTESISLRLPAYMLRRLKELANARDVPYQSLLKIFLAERIEQELRGGRVAK